ncbi:cation:proton antiporter [Flavobacterium sp.]|uniref:cation:proton antiporter domain-containing protein n=1 Tax=Flavobacterium sp. TaxID=239 RepID=UPI003D115D1C
MVSLSNPQITNLELFIHVACAIVVIIIMARVVGSLMVYIKQPRVVGEMIAGILLGPTFLSTIFPDFTNYLFDDTKSTIYILGNIGLSIYMFLVGIEIDFRKVDKLLKKQSWILCIVATVIPFGVGGLVSWMYFDQLAIFGTTEMIFMIFMGTALSIMAFPMLARILDEKKIIKTKLGTLALLSASGQDVITWILLAFIISLAKTGSFKSGIITLVGAVIFVGFAFFIARPLLKKMARNINKKGIVNQTHFSIVIVTLLISAIITDKIGLYSVFGGFIIGLAMPREDLLINEVKVKLTDLTVVFLLPLFFAFSGLKTNFLKLFAPEFLIPSLVIVLLAFACKYIPVLLSMKITGYSWRESSAIGGLMTARGLMELIVASIGLEYEIIDQNTFSILVLIAVSTTLTAMPIYNLSLKKHKTNDKIAKQIENKKDKVLEIAS